MNIKIDPYILGIRNERENQFNDFCIKEQLVIANTFFKRPKRRLYTCRSPRDKPQKIVKNQVNLKLVNKRFKKAIKTYRQTTIQ